jgi:hypothetical protein
MKKYFAKPDTSFKENTECKLIRERSQNSGLFSGKHIIDCNNKYDYFLLDQGHKLGEEIKVNLVCLFDDFYEKGEMIQIIVNGDHVHLNRIVNEQEAIELLKNIKKIKREFVIYNLKQREPTKYKNRRVCLYNSIRKRGEHFNCDFNLNIEIKKVII